MPEHTFQADERFTKALDTSEYGRVARSGYLLWGRPVVRAMRASSAVSDVVETFAMAIRDVGRRPVLCYALGRLAETFASFTGVASTGSVALVATWPSGARTSSGSESRVHLVHPPMRRSDCRTFLLATSSTLFSGHQKCHKTLPTTFMLSVMHVHAARLSLIHVIAVPCHIMSCTLSCPAASALLVRCGVFLFLFDDAKILTTRSRQQFNTTNYGLLRATLGAHTGTLTHRRQVYGVWTLS